MINLTLILDKADNYYSIILNCKRKPIEIYFKYDKDSLVNRIVVSKIDSTSYKTYRTYLAQDYKIATSFVGDFIYQSDNNFSLHISFIDKFNMNYVVYRESEVFSVYVKFLKNNIPNIYGHYNLKGRTGIWYTYYENGRLSSEGEYSGSDFDSNGNEINIKKTGKWVYYTNQGCVEKEEIWDNGKLISPDRSDLSPQR